MTSLDGESIFWSALERPKEYASNGAPIPDDLSDKLQYLFSDFHQDVLDCLKSFENKNVKRCNFGVVKDIPVVLGVANVVFQNLQNQEMLLPIFIFSIRRLVKKLFHFEVMFR